MTNPLFYLFALLIALTYPTGIEPLHFLRPEHRALPIVDLPAIPSLGAALIVIHLLIGLLLYPRWTGGRVSRRALLMRFLALLFFAVDLFILHFPVWLEEIGLPNIPVLTTLALLSPFLLMNAGHAILAARKAKT